MNEKTAQFDVSGLKCDGCIARARDALAEVPGVIAAEFDLAAGRVEITGQIDPETVCATLGKAGYPTVQT